MKNYLFIFLMCMAVAAKAQNEQAIAAALKIFNDASDQAGMEQAVEAMKSVSDKDNNDWLAAYWTSFFSSQAGRNSADPAAHYDRAQEYYDRAVATNADKSASELSDFHALQSLIHDLKAGVHWSKGDRANGTKLNGQASLELNKAIKANKKNPRVYLLTGTDLISNGLRMQNNSWVMAGKEMLEKARDLYETQKPESDIAPNWGSGWINFWLSRAQID